MTTTTDTPFLANVAATQSELLRSGASATEVLVHTVRHIQQIQLNAGAEMVANSLENIAPAFSPAGAPYWLQQQPQFYATQANAQVKAVTEVFNELLRAQQTLRVMNH